MGRKKKAKRPSRQPGSLPKIRKSITHPPLRNIAEVGIAEQAQPTTPAGYWITQETYEKHRAVLLDLLKANVDQHDKAVLQLTAATLGVSITFVDRVIPTPLPDTVTALVIAWALLVFSTLSMLASFWTGKKACLADLADWDDRFRSGAAGRESTSWWSVATNWLTLFGSVFFSVGLILTVIFCCLNIGITRPSSTLPQGKPTNVDNNRHSQTDNHTQDKDSPSQLDVIQNAK
jgi:hypothetical protein